MSQILILVGQSTLETLIMTFFSALFALILGFPLGVLLNITNKFGITPKPVLNIILIVLLPFTRLVLGSAIGTAPTIVPLAIAAMPFVARITETALNEVDTGMIQAAKAMGSTNWQIIYKVLVPEAMPSVISGVTLTIITLIGYSAMAGTLGGGGLGDLAIRYGYQRFRTGIMVAAVIVIIILVALIQFVGTKITNHMMSKR